MLPLKFTGVLFSDVCFRRSISHSDQHLMILSPFQNPFPRPRAENGIPKERTELPAFSFCLDQDESFYCIPGTMAPFSESRLRRAAGSSRSGEVPRRAAMAATVPAACPTAMQVACTR